MLLLSAPNAAVAPEIATAFDAENTERVRKLHNHACQVALWVSGALIIGLVLFGAWLVELWTRGAVHMQWDIFVVFLAILIVNGLWLASLMLVYATNRHTRVAVVYVAANLGALAGAYFLGRLFGLTGITISVLAAEVIMAIYVVRGCLVLLDEPLGGLDRPSSNHPSRSSDASCARSNRGVVRRTKAANLGVL
jgi:O-antigen/teichoic acid export membrane protein